MNVLILSVLIITLAMGLIRYFRSRHARILGAFFLFTTWRNIGVFVFTFFYYAWNKVHPENDRLMYHRDLLTVTHAILLAKIIAGMIILRNLFPSHTTDSIHNSSGAIQGIRGFHFLLDRFLLITGGTNFFVVMYLYPTEDQNTEMGIWIFLSVEVALIACYFLCEKLIGVTPAKVLTGTSVGYTNASLWNLSTTTALQRTFSRLIPFDAFSFMSSKNGWHDRLSGTTVYYTAEGHWLKRQNRLVVILFSILLFLVVWYLTGRIARHDVIHCNTCVDSSTLSSYLLVFIFPLAVLLFTGWLAAIVQYTVSLTSKSYPSSYSVYTVIATWWIPLYNLGIFAYTLKPMLEALETSGISEDAKQRCKRSASALRICFALFQIVILGALLLSLKVGDRYYVMEILSLSLSVGTICWCIGTLRFCTAVDCLLTNISAK